MTGRPPYLFTQFNVLSFYPNTSGNAVILSRVLNALVYTINEYHHLPKHILIMLDKDLITNAKMFDYGAVQAFKNLIKWLVKEFNMIINTRKEDLRNKKPGAITSYAEPRLIWVKMLPRPIIESQCACATYSLCRKFNDALEEVIRDDRHSHVLLLQVQANQGNFDCDGDLTLLGRIEY